MSNLDVLHEAFEKAGDLRRVLAARFGGDPTFVTELKFVFEGFALLVRADGEYDEVVLGTGDFSDEPEISIHDVSADAPWSEALGRTICWGWELTNQQGYADGVRFDFANSTGGKFEVELIVAASSLHAYRCEPTGWSAA
jgi:hypothetical protein